ncbi:hypothetical protein [Aeromonas salmonicida]|uniref:hypothetical protein n=1 Tax=Aeromonas salmonicida TaxID=645 RepID=UPI001F4E7679|nr:hypothetical protein [Aeromonas salmonicida]
MVLVKPVIHGLGINPESERATVDQRPVVLRPIGDGVKRFTHDADLRGMVVLRSLGFQLVPFKLHRFRKQRRSHRQRHISDPSFPFFAYALPLLPLGEGVRSCHIVAAWKQRMTTQGEKDEATAIAAAAWHGPVPWRGVQRRPSLGQHTARLQPGV